MIPYGAEAGTIDLGNEPPLLLGDDDKADDTYVPRAVSWRWMGGTVLTGLTSVFLMGTALFVALANTSQLASLPDSMASSSVPHLDDVVYGRKGDRIKPTEEKVSTRQVLQVSTITRQGDRDFIKLKPFAKVSASLTTTGAELAEQVPAYDPLKIFADTSAPAEPTDASDVTVAAGPEDTLYGAAVDGEVAVKVSDFPLSGADVEPLARLETAEVEQIVKASARLTSFDSPALSYADMGADMGGNASDPFSALGVSITAENVSNVAKTTTGIALDEGYTEKIISVAQSENLRTLFEQNEITGDNADEIIAALSQLVDVSRLRPGQKVRVAFASPYINPADPTATDTRLNPIRVSVYADGAHQATVALSDNNVFVRADEPSISPELFAEAPVEEPKEKEGPVRLYDAVYRTALAQQVPRPLIDQLIRVFAFDADLQQRVGAGDSLEVFHSMPDNADSDTLEPEVLYASLTLGSTTRRYYRFRTSDDGIVDYYDEEGRSSKKFLLRKPVTAGVMRSGFGRRVHPILGYGRLHAGVDYAAPKGTPILAAGNGVVEKAGRSSGYGNLTILKHTNGYTTRYAHQSAFAKGLKPGVRVRQGQVIGYVGTTGLSTGNHLHYEIHVNGKPVDPLRIRLPQGRSLEGDYLSSFVHERQRIDALLGIEGQTPTKVASAGN